MWLTRGGSLKSCYQIKKNNETKRGSNYTGFWLGKFWCFRSVIAPGRWLFTRGSHTWIRLDCTLEPRCNEGSRDWNNNLFAITRFRYIVVLFILLLLEWRKSFITNRGLLYWDSIVLYYYHENCIPVSCFGIKTSCPEKS